LLGYVMKKLKFPTAPFVIAFLLGPMAERAIRQSLMISQGDFTVFVTQPIRLAFLTLTIIVITATGFRRFMASKKKKKLV
ncbi:MAG: hypothetical protein SCJ93_13345, partial [Bacillota bacterium]|nr:hypothetical protein [Bacillota bacterium]